MPGDIDGYILTGGRSQRMGESKARIAMGGRTFAQRVADALEPNVRRVFTVGERVLYPHIENISDSVSDGQSSLRGLVSALRHASTKWIIVAACDMPFVTDQMFAMLINGLDDANGAVIPLSEEARPQPLCALYRVEPCYEICNSALLNDELRLSRLLPLFNSKYLDHSVFRNLPGSERFFMNINTPEELQAAKSLVRDES